MVLWPSNFWKRLISRLCVKCTKRTMTHRTTKRRFVSKDVSLSFFFSYFFCRSSAGFLRLHCYAATRVGHSVGSTADFTKLSLLLDGLWINCPCGRRAWGIIVTYITGRWLPKPDSDFAVRSMFPANFPSDLCRRGMFHGIFVTAEPLNWPDNLWRRGISLSRAYFQLENLCSAFGLIFPLTLLGRLQNSGQRNCLCWTTESSQMRPRRAKSGAEEFRRPAVECGPQGSLGKSELLQ